MTLVRTLLFVLLAAATGMACAQDWKRLGPSAFPARVEAIEFGTGSILNQSKSVGWGRWSVSLSEQTKATYGAFPGGYKNIWIQPLTCSNEVAGVRQCFMGFVLDQGSWTCAIGGTGGSQIDIACPTELKLR